MKGTRRRVVGIAAGALTIVAMAPTHRVSAGGPAFANSAISGGGFISVIAAAPDGTVVAGGDTEGIFRSTNDGLTWTPQGGTLASTDRGVAALLYQGSTWYAAVGNGAGGGIATSQDDGVTWSVAQSGATGGPPLFDGGNLPGQQGQPRATGSLLASDGTFLYAASFGMGLQRWPLNATSVATGWQCVALCTSYLNALTLDGAGDAFVSIITRTGGSDGVDEVTNIAGGAQAESISASSGVSTGVQELVHLGSRLYAAGSSGIGYWGAGKWTVVDKTKHWYTLAGYEPVAGTTPTDVLYASGYSGHGVSDVEQIVLHGTTATITGLVPHGSVGSVIAGTSTPWWEATAGGGASALAGPADMIGGCQASTNPACNGSTMDGYAGSSIVVLGQTGGLDPLLVAGRSGVWQYQPSQSPAWTPAVNGLATTFESAVAVDPADPGNVAVADDDWNTIVSTAGLGSVAPVQPPLFNANGQFTLGLAVAWDASVSPSALIVSGGLRNSDGGGMIWYSDGWSTNAGWTAIPLPSGVSTRPIALATQVLAPGTYELLAAFQTSGVYVFTGSGASGSWTEIPSNSSGPTVSPSDTHGVSLSWAENGGAIYMYDEGTHAVWDSVPGPTGFTPWNQLYANPKKSGRGWAVGDPVSPGVVWIADSNGLGTINTLTCSGGCTPSWLVSSQAGGSGGPLTTTSGASGDFVDMAGGGPKPVFWQVQTEGCATACPSVNEIADPYYAEVGGNAISLASGSDGGLYVSTLGNGVAVAPA